MVLDAVARLVPGVLGSDESSEDESFTTGLVEYPQYTRPADFRGAQVPPVLLGGNHADIVAWRREQSLELTLERRPGLLETAPLTDADRDMLDRLARARAVSARLDDLGLSHERLELRLADQWPKQWLNAFVSEENRKAAKKQCISGRRHVGYLWQAFTMGFVPDFLEGEPARAAWREKAPRECLLYLPEDRLLYAVRGDISPEALGELGPFVLADADLTRTLMGTGREGNGPYFRECPRRGPAS